MPDLSYISTPADLEVGPAGDTVTVRCCRFDAPYGSGEARQILRARAFARSLEQRGSRVKLTRDGATVGRAVELREDAEGLMATFRLTVPAAVDDVDEVRLAFRPVRSTRSAADELEHQEVALAEVELAAKAGPALDVPLPREEQLRQIEILRRYQRVLGEQRPSHTITAQTEALERRLYRAERDEMTRDYH